jgi:hypothetical protein
VFGHYLQVASIQPRLSVSTSTVLDALSVHQYGKFDRLSSCHASPRQDPLADACAQRSGDARNRTTTISTRHRPYEWHQSRRGAMRSPRSINPRSIDSSSQPVLVDVDVRECLEGKPAAERQREKRWARQSHESHTGTLAQAGI